MAESSGFDASIYYLSANGTCTCSSDRFYFTGGTCTKIGDLNSYTKNFSRETIDVTEFGDKVRKVIPGFPNATLSGSGTYNYADAAQAAIHTAMEATSSPSQMVLILKEKNIRTFMKGYLTADNSGSSVGSVSSFSFEFTSNSIPYSA